MTQPVQEPTQGRMDSGQGYRTRQLFRRPAAAAGTGDCIPSLNSSYASAAIALNPLVYWEFQDCPTLGTIVDSSGNDHVGHPNIDGFAGWQNGIEWRKTGPLGGADVSAGLYPWGSGVGVFADENGLSNDASDFSVAMWIRPNTDMFDTPEGRLFANYLQDYDTAKGWSAELNGGWSPPGPQVIAKPEGSGGAGLILSDPITWDTGWHHVVVSRDVDIPAWDCYLDGANTGYTSNLYGDPDMTGIYQWMYASPNVSCDLAHVSYFEYSLSGAEVSALYAAA